MKKLHVLAAMHELGRFTAAEVATRADTSSSSVHTVIQRSPETWFTRRQLSSGVRGGQPTQFELSPQGRVAIVETLGRVASEIRLAPPRMSYDVPLGLQSALDTLNELGRATDAEVVTILYADALRDLEWAEAEVKGTGYSENARVLLEQLSQARVDLAAYAPSVAQPAGAPSVVATIEAVPGRAVAVARSVYERVAALVVGMWGESPVLTPQTLASLRTGRHVIIGRVGADRGSDELSWMATYALEGALAQARGQNKELNLLIHRLESDQLAKLLLQARDLSDIHDNSLFLLVVNSAAGESEAQRSLERTKAIGTGFNAAILDRAFSESLEQFSRHNHVRYEPKAAELSRLGWVSETVTQYTSPLPIAASARARQGVIAA
jgi:hypothetical protein